MSTPHLQKIMTAENYIQAKLDELRKPIELVRPANEAQLIDAIIGLIMSKKFRKYSASPELIEHIKHAVRLNVEKKEPINLTLQQGAFKLWRLDESPEVDWADLFALMYYIRWVRPICEIYEPGVVFDFYIHDLIIPMLNNIPVSDTQVYIAGYRALMDFLRPYEPENLHIQATPVSSQFASPEVFQQVLERHLQALTARLPGGLPEMTDADIKVVELNVELTDEQQKDPQWREKVWRLHSAYLDLQDELGYREGRPEKILVSTLPVPAANTIAVGTTKSSIMKHWLGSGTLKKEGTDYHQVIYSPTQLEKIESTWEPVNIAGLAGRNFSKIRISS